MEEENNYTIKICAQINFNIFFQSLFKLPTDKKFYKNTIICFAKQFNNFIKAVVCEIAHNTYKRNLCLGIHFNIGLTVKPFPSLCFTKDLSTFLKATFIDFNVA